MVQLWWVSLVSAALSLLAEIPAPLSGVASPAPLRSLSAEFCRSCHEAQFQQWQRSRHAVAATNALFRASFHQDPMDWCISCHAPLPEQLAELKKARGIAAGRSAIVDEGVNCAVCHLREGAILSSRPATAAAQRAHPIRVTAELASSAFCGRCHQVNWPLSIHPFRDSVLPMQDTLAESQNVRPLRSCQSCHMPAGSHRFPGGHDVGWLRETLSAKVWVESGGLLHVRVRARGIGHRFPTGDPFRRLQADVCAEPDCAEPLAILSFGKFFRDKNDHQVLMRDTALPAPKGRDLEIERQLSRRIKPPRTALFWRLRYAYAAPTTERALTESEIAADVASGSVEQVP